MNKGFDLTKILDGCPPGTKFYSTIYGVIEFLFIEDYCSDDRPLIFLAFGNDELSHKISVSKDGRLITLYPGECIVFPSYYQRDWSKFERFWDKTYIEKFDPRTLLPFDKVLVRGAGEWICGLFSHLQSNNNKLDAVVDGFNWWQCIPFNEETKHLVGTTNDCPEYYKWWEE